MSDAPILITGAGGFLGYALARALKDRGHSLRTLQRGEYPHLAHLGSDNRRADLTDPAAVRNAVDGCQAVFHVAAKAGIWGSRDSFWQANVAGTQNLLLACRDSGVGKLIYTSTPSVAHGGGDLEGVDERAPYPQHFRAHYPATKAEAEQAVLAANGPDLATVALRPHLIWGPGDQHLLPRLAERARRGRLVLLEAPGKRIDTVYIANAVAAHVAAYDRLGVGAACAGKAYFIAQGDPRPLAEIVTRLLEAAGLPSKHRTVSAAVAWPLAMLCEGLWTLLRRRDDPPLTRFMVEQLSTSHWYDLSAARRDLGYEASISLDQGMAALRAFHQRCPIGTAPEA